MMFKKIILLIWCSVFINLVSLPLYAAEITIAYLSNIKSADLKIKSIKCNLNNDIYEFQIDCESGVARGYSLFNPPAGDKLMKVMSENGINPGNNIIKIEAEKNAIDSIEDIIVMKFWKNNEGRDSDDYLVFSLKKSSALLKKIFASRSVQSGNKASVKLPAADPNKKSDWQTDLRGRDLSKFDLAARTQDLLRSDFDSLTKWPQKLPEGFPAEKIMKLAKDPGLMVRELHKNKITGRGVSLAIIDQKLDTAHIEIKNRVKLYEERYCIDEKPAMHGAAVSSIAAGSTLGVAPEANLYYIAETHGTISNGSFEFDFTILAKSIERLLEINSSLAPADKIRVISISVGFEPYQKGYKEVMAAIDKAKKDNVFVVSTSLENTYDYCFQGLEREPFNDPNDINSFGPGSFWEREFYEKPGYLDKPTLLVPMDSRCTASETGSQNYVFYRYGGLSWSVPYIAGLYSLSCQVSPDLTPEKFWQAALKTGDRITITKKDKKYQLGLIVNPIKLIAELKKSNKQ